MYCVVIDSSYAMGGLTASSGAGSYMSTMSVQEEVERTKLSIKQKAAELSKKTRSSFRRKGSTGSVSNGGGRKKNGGAGGGRKHLLPSDRYRRSKKVPRKIEEDDGDGGGDDTDAFEGSLSHYESTASLRHKFLRPLLILCYFICSRIGRPRLHCISSHGPLCVPHPGHRTLFSLPRH